LRLKENDTTLRFTSTLTIISILFLTAYYIYCIGWGSFSMILFLDVITIVFVLAILRVAGFNGNWPGYFSLITVVVMIGLYSLVQVILTYILGEIYAAVLFTVLIGVVLCIVGRKLEMSWLAPAMLLSLFAGINSILIEFLPGAVDPTIPAEQLPGAAQLGTAFLLPSINATVATFVILGWIKLKRTGTVDFRTPLQTLLKFNCSVAFVFVLVGLYEIGLYYSESVIVAALYFFVAMIWHILASGHNVTNIDSAWFSRRSRLLLFFSFITLTLAGAVFMESLQAPSKIFETVRLVMKPDFAVLAGLIMLAPAMLGTMFVLRLGTWATRDRIFARPAQ
jgi:hypothetical protein